MQTTRNLNAFYTWLNDPKRQQDNDLVQTMLDAFVTKRKGNTRYLEDSHYLLEALNEYNVIKDLCTYWTIESTYLYLLNQTWDDDQVKAELSKAETHSTKVFNTLKFFEISLGTIPTEKQEVIMMDSRLSSYHFYLWEIFELSQYQLTEWEEKVISVLSWPAITNWKRMFEEFFYAQTVNWEWEILSVSQVMSKISDVDKETRDRAAAEFNTLLVNQISIAEKEINTVMEYRMKIDELRGFPYPQKIAYIRDSVDHETVESLSKSVIATNTLAKDYYALKAKILWLEKLAYHERSVPIVVWDETTYSIEEAVELVVNAFAGVKPAYGEFVQSLFDEWRVDIYPRPWKRWWAFCVTDLSESKWVFVFMNYTDKLIDVRTIAHECGHALNWYLSSKKNKWIMHWSWWYFIAEVASTFFEWIVFDALLERIDSPQQKIALLMNSLGDAIATVHRQIATYIFEKELYSAKKELGYLKHEKIWELYQQAMMSYMWDAVEQSPWSQNRWAYVSHLRSFFYNYPYAGGHLLASALRKKLASDKMFINQIQEQYFEKSAASSPRTIFANLWVDITDESTRKNGLDQMQSKYNEIQTLINTYGRDG